AGELLAALTAPTSSPVASVGSAVIDRVPGPLKDAAIALFGTADKLALVVSIALVIAGLAAVGGLLERRRPPLGAVLTGLLGLLGALAALTRADASPFSALPAAAAGLVAVLALRHLLSFVDRPAPRAVARGDREASPVVGHGGAVTAYSRRRFVA